MATQLTVTPLTRAGVTPALTAADATGNTFLNGDEHTFLVVKNGGGAGITVSLDILTTIDGQPVTDRTVSVPAAGERWIGPFPKIYYNNASDLVTVTYSGVTSVTVGAFSV